ncbi:hypothetical protein [Streptomyces sp. NPDC026092]|uniref:hypothetical protein n=1 Tax=Streptomyces sp. NPDC026092 TaxID=3154797 RepID=UPI0033FCD644
MSRSRYEADQIVFRWDSENAVGTTGFGPVAWSGQRDEVEALFQIYGALLRASGEETRPALLRVEQPAGVVLIRRMPGRDPGGRASVVCHALVGSPELLDPAFCLGLHAWDWQGAELPSGLIRGALPAVPREALVASAVAGQRALDLALPGVEYELTGMVAELLRHPQARFTVLDERGDTAYAVLRGLHAMFTDVPRPRRWTFASHDTVELNKLRYVFVGQWAGAASRNTDRRRVDPRERIGDRAEELAARLVHHHLDGPEGAVVAALREAPGAGDLSLLESAERAVARLDAARARRASTDDTKPPEPARGPAWVQDEEAPYGAQEAGGPPAVEPAAPVQPVTPVVPVEPVVPVAPPAWPPAPYQPPQVLQSPQPPPTHQPPPPPPPPPPPQPHGDLPVVAPVWRGPEGSKAWWRRGRSRRGRPVETGLVRWLAADADDAEARVRAAGDRELLTALRGHRSYRVTTLLMREIARRLPHWPQSLRREFGDLVIAHEFFVTAPRSALLGEPDEAERAANAAALHRWAVRPLLDEGDAPGNGVLVALLTRLRASPVPAARAAFQQIVDDERPGLPEAVWRALVQDPALPPEPVPTPVPTPVAFHAQAPHSQAPHSQAPHPQAPPPLVPSPPPPAPAASPPRPPGDGKLVFLALLAVIVTLVSVIVSMVVT